MARSGTPLAPGLDMKEGNMKKPRDTRDAKKSEDIENDPYDTGGSQQAAELQVGKEGERANPDRFEPDPKAEPPAKTDPAARAETGVGKPERRE